jgi:hypothetical protein
MGILDKIQTYTWNGVPFITYGMIGLTTVVLAIITILDTETPDEENEPIDETEEQLYESRPENQLQEPEQNIEDEDENEKQNEFIGGIKKTKPKPKNKKTNKNRSKKTQKN